MITPRLPECHVSVVYRYGLVGHRGPMIAVAGMALAAGAGVLLAALENPNAGNSPRLRKLCTVLLIASGATLAAAGADAIW